MSIVSIVIPTYNGRDTIIKCISSVLSQGHKEFECIVVDDASTDDTCQLIRDMDIKLIRLAENMGPSYARNIGVANAKGEYIAFLDADCVAPKDWLENFLKNFDKQKMSGITGPYSGSADDSTLSQTVDHYIRESQKVHREYINNCITANTFIRKSDFKAINGFPLYQYPWEKKFRHGNEDGELAYLLVKNTKKPFLWLEENGVQHFHRSTYKKHFKQQKDLAETLLVSILRYPGMLLLSSRSIFTIRRLVILSMIPLIFTMIIVFTKESLLLALVLIPILSTYLQKKYKSKVIPMISYPLITGLSWIIGGILGLIKFLISFPFWLLKPKTASKNA